MPKEAQSRIKINKLLEAAGWRFFDSVEGQANVALEAKVKITQTQVDALGNDFESTGKGFIDFLLLDEHSFPLVVLEAKAESKNPLIGKEQARRYAKNHNCRFVILSNGNLHYLWDLQQGNPHVITAFPTPHSIKGYSKFNPDPSRLVTEDVPLDYIARTQIPGYDAEVGWKDAALREDFTQTNKLRFMRLYQQRAAQSIQAAVKDGKTRFLFEMATGTGKTLTSAAVIKLFLRTGNARRVLFLVDRLELEDQANKAFVALLKNDYKSAIYKENRDDWRKAEIVVTTVQSLLFNAKYKQFAPTDFDLVIPELLYHFITSSSFRAIATPAMTGTGGLQRVPKAIVEAFQIPLPPLEVQHQIVSEIEGYQKVIDGARQVLDYYQPQIAISPDWALTPLENACEIQRGKFSHRPRNEPRFYGGTYPFIQTGDIVRAAGGGKVTYTQTLNEEGLSVSKLFQPPLVVITIAANIGDTAVLDFPCCFPDSVVGLTPKGGTDAGFLELMMRLQKEHLNNIAPQAAQKNINIEILKTIKIPLPNLDTQRAIVAEIEAEQALVHASRELIRRMEAKVKATIDRVWGAAG